MTILSPVGTRKNAAAFKKQLSVKMSANFWTTLQIAYYNMGVELEHLGKYNEAVLSL
jgi:hypothetical protein